jgi:CRP-like cAMP-binding protein
VKQLHGQPQRILKKLQENQTVEKYKHGSIVCVEGTTAKSIFIVKQGSFQIEKNTFQPKVLLNENELI